METAISSASPLRCLAQSGDEFGDFLPPVVPCSLGCCAPLRESFVPSSGLAGAAHQVGEVRDLPHRPLARPELGDGHVGLDVLLVRYAVHAEVPPENVQARRGLDFDPVVLEVGIDGAAARHDDHQMCVPFVDGITEDREVGPCRGPLAVVRGRQVQQQAVTGFDQSRVVEGQLAFLAGKKLVEDAAAPVVLAQEYPGRRGAAAAWGTVQDDGASVGERGAGLAHVDGVDQHTSQPTKLVFSDAPEGRLVRVL
ncbi:hypothetical protein [Streptomyces sp. DSM 40750]|uniref:hypothetical protein n=1 Tax=Streptomyces sp. DSM 40750 TaxID=2801030 RepID=UPI00214B1314|nr:hypothetical protein [Streptomyces sp. DSM 40750]UUU25859.1 hypothetical protein JIX55_39585 [Streptomyces sp. DSM 40750]